MAESRKGEQKPTQLNDPPKMVYRSTIKGHIIKRQAVRTEYVGTIWKELSLIKMEQSRQNRINRLSFVAERLRKKFETIILNGEECFILPSGTIIQVNALGGEYDALVIGFAENMEEAKLNRFDDGSLYYMDELGPEEMFNEMMKEIENEM